MCPSPRPSFSISLCIVGFVALLIVVNYSLLSMQQENHITLQLFQQQLFHIFSQYFLNIAHQ